MAARMWLTFLELQVHGEGLTEADLRGGSKHRRTDHPWPVAEDHKQLLRSLLEPNGFDIMQMILAQEFVDRDAFLLTQ